MLSRLSMFRSVRPTAVTAVVAVRPVIVAIAPQWRVRAMSSKPTKAESVTTGDADKHVHHHYVWESGRRTAEEGDWTIALPQDSQAPAEVELEGETVVVPPLYETLEWPLTSPMDFHTYEETPAIKETIVDDKSHDSKHEE